MGHYRWILTSLALAAALHAQRHVWVVDWAGRPGAHFADIPPAISAASPGDRIEVRDGTYGGFLLGKGLEIEALGVVQLSSRCDIQAIPATEVAKLIGFSGGMLRVQNCVGAVFLSRLQFQSGAGAAVGIVDCAAIVLTRSSLTATLGAPFNYVGALYAERSRLAVQDTRLIGGPGRDGLLQAPEPGNDGLYARGSEVLLSACILQGGRGGASSAPCFCSCPPAAGGPALRTDGGALCMNACQLAGGPGGLGWTGCATGPTGPAAVTARVTSDCTLSGPTIQVTTIGALAAVTCVDQVARGLPLTLHFTGAPSTPLVAFMDIVPGFLDPAAADGFWLLGGNAFPFASTALGGAGVLDLILAVPSDPSLQNLLVLIQAVAVPAGTPRPSLTNCADVWIR